MCYKRARIEIPIRVRITDMPHIDAFVLFHTRRSLFKLLFDLGCTPSRRRARPSFDGSWTIEPSRRTVATGEGVQPYF
jgi:hypothetical protein